MTDPAKTLVVTLTIGELDALQRKDRSRVHGRDLDWLRSRSVVDANGCWLWSGAVTSRGYGSTSVPGKRGRSQTVHRLALAIKLGRPVRGMALHSCDVPRCCNPDHLREGDAWDNARDAVERGRVARGEGNGSAKITSALAADIKAALDHGTPIGVVSRLSGVARHVVHEIAAGRTWRDSA